MRGKSQSDWYISWRRSLAYIAPGEGLTSQAVLQTLKAKFGHRVHADVARSSLASLKQRRGQTLRQLSLETERLVAQAYGMADQGTREVLATEAYLQAIYDLDVRIQVRLAQPDTLQKAVDVAEMVESALRQARTAGRGTSVNVVAARDELAKSYGEQLLERLQGNANLLETQGNLQQKPKSP